MQIMMVGKKLVIASFIRLRPRFISTYVDILMASISHSVLTLPGLSSFHCCFHSMDLFLQYSCSQYSIVLSQYLLCMPIGHFSIQRASQYYPAFQRKSIVIVTSKISSQFNNNDLPKSTHPQNELHQTMLNVKWIIVHLVVAFKISGVIPRN